MDSRRYELVTLAAARALRSSYCSLAHGRVLEAQFFSAEDVTRIARRDEVSSLEPVEVAVMAFAEKVVRQADSVTREDVDLLRRHGLTDGEIFDVAAAAAARCFFSKTLDALGAEPDASYEALEPDLREALTVGRPISREGTEALTS
jgi:alkylhydroperoxidase family enzyme